MTERDDHTTQLLQYAFDSTSNQGEILSSGRYRNNPNLSESIHKNGIMAKKNITSLNSTGKFNLNSKSKDLSTNDVGPLLIKDD